MAWSALYEEYPCWAAPSSLRAAFAEARLDSMDSSQAPTRVKMCEGMCSACGADGAMEA